MKYKYLFTDLDETSIVNHHVPKENQTAIQKAQELGVKIIPCTGRDLNIIQDILEEMNIKNKENEYSICCNGAVVRENTGKVIYYNGITEKQLDIFLDYCTTVDGVILFFAQEGIYMLQPNEFERQRKIDQGANLIVYPDVKKEYLKGVHVIKMMIAQEDEKKRECILKNMPSYLVETCEVTLSSGRYIELNAKGVTKGNGMKALMEYLEDSLDNCIAIGDHYNDCSMIEMAGLGCAVANAVELLKEKANYICKNNYENFALKEVIDKFITEYK